MLRTDEELGLQASDQAEGGYAVGYGSEFGGSGAVCLQSVTEFEYKEDLLVRE